MSCSPRFFLSCHSPSVFPRHLHSSDQLGLFSPSSLLVGTYWLSLLFEAACVFLQHPALSSSSSPVAFPRLRCASAAFTARPGTYSRRNIHFHCTPTAVVSSYSYTETTGHPETTFTFIYRPISTEAHSRPLNSSPSSPNPSSTDSPFKQWSIASMASSTPATPDTLVTLKVNFQGSTRRFKLPLRDLGACSLEDKVRHNSIWLSLISILGCLFPPHRQRPLRCQGLAAP